MLPLSPTQENHLPLTEQSAKQVAGGRAESQPCPAASGQDHGCSEELAQLLQSTQDTCSKKELQKRPANMHSRQNDASADSCQKKMLSAIDLKRRKVHSRSQSYDLQCFISWVEELHTSKSIMLESLSCERKLSCSIKLIIRSHIRSIDFLINAVWSCMRCRQAPLQS